ncbi:ATP-binding protein, partial [bacterium]|nr:ATP-binding protein [bacterium]
MPSKIRLVICSGKGGVGKSMLTSVLSILFAKKYKVVAVDCDVDAPNLAIWLNETKNFKSFKISTSEKPVINNSKLKEDPQKFAKKCKFGALKAVGKKLKLNSFLCEGCGACEIFCPPGVIKMRPVKNGEIRIKKTKYGFPLISGQLYPGETGSGKIVTEIKKEAEKFDYEIQILDSAPGTGCPVIAALRDANFVILISEPTPSGFSDLKRVFKIVKYFNIPYGLVINKWDINARLSEKMKKWSKNPEGKQVPYGAGKFLGKISYDKEIFKAISNLKPIFETDLIAKTEIQY